jgi:sugar-specific transcriptional regulator TrmB
LTEVITLNNRNDLASALNALGLNAYEAKSYIALLALGSGNGYAVAKNAGIPTAKVYEALASLAAKGFAVSDGMKSPQYKPLPPEKVLGAIKNDFSSKIDMLIPDLKTIASNPKELGVQSIHGSKQVYDAIKKLIKEAETKILLTAWPEDIKNIEKELKKAAKSIKVYILSNGPSEIPNAEMFFHRRTDMVKDYLPGRWLMAASEKEGVGAFFNDSGEAQCIWTENTGISKIFGDHILHDISVNYVINKFPEDQKGPLEEELRQLRHKLRV